jgi:hypothetical protein
MRNLPLQIRERHLVVIDNPDRTHTRRREVEQGRRPQPTRANDQHPRIAQPRLPRATNLPKDDVPRVPFELFVGESHAAYHRRKITPHATPPMVLRFSRMREKLARRASGVTDEGTLPQRFRSDHNGLETCRRNRAS